MIGKPNKLPKHCKSVVFSAFALVLDPTFSCIFRVKVKCNFLSHLAGLRAQMSAHVYSQHYYTILGLLTETQTGKNIVSRVLHKVQ